MSDTIYTLLDISDEDSSGPIHERIATIFEVVRGHTSVLAEFRRRPGRWLLWIDVDDASCPDCGENAGRYVQFAFLEDALRALGWKDPVEDRTPNLHVEVTSDEGVIELGRITERTLLQVFGLELRDRAVIKFQERILHRKAS